MAGFETFERDLKVATAGLSEPEIARKLARFARSELAREIRSGRASPTYETYVNGRRGAAEESVVPPGPILYVFTNWPLIIRAAIAELVKRVPKRSGRYAGGFVVLANGAVSRDHAQIPPDAEVTVFNTRPYTRRMETGAQGGGKNHFRNARQALIRRFDRDGRTMRIEVKYITPPAGIHPDVPYVLRGRQRIAAAKADMRSAAFRAGRPRLAPRKALEAGQRLTYPALVMRF